MGGDESILERFEKLPFKDKVIFVNKPFPQYKSAFYIRNFENEKNGKVNTIWRTQNLIMSLFSIVSVTVYEKNNS